MRGEGFFNGCPSLVEPYCCDGQTEQMQRIFVDAVLPFSRPIKTFNVDDLTREQLPFFYVMSEGGYLTTLGNVIPV